MLLSHFILKYYNNNQNIHGINCNNIAPSFYFTIPLFDYHILSEKGAINLVNVSMLIIAVHGGL